MSKNKDNKEQPTEITFGVSQEWAHVLNNFYYNKMYKPKRMQSTSIKVNDSYEGESIEAKVRRIISNKEPIKDGAPIIYTERKDGVQPSYNIRTDRFEIAVEAMQGISKAHLAKREERAKIIEMKDTKKDGEIGDQSIQGTDNK